MPANHFRNCDFRGAEIDRCKFLNIEFEKTLFPDDPDILVLPGDAEDLRSWSALFSVERLGKIGQFVSEMIDGASRPYLFPLVLFGPLFTDEEIGWLKEIARRDP